MTLTPYQKSNVSALQRNTFTYLIVKPNQNPANVRYAIYWQGRRQNKKFSVAVHSKQTILVTRM